MGVTNQHRWYTNSLQDYGARYYLPFLRRFISADTVVPGAGNPQALNRYAYVLNSPLNFIDPSGHVPLIDGILTSDSTQKDKISDAVFPGSAGFTGQTFILPSGSTGQSQAAKSFVAAVTSGGGNIQYVSSGSGNSSGGGSTSSPKSNVPVEAALQDIGNPTSEQIYNPSGTLLDCTISVSWWLFAGGEGFPMTGIPGQTYPFQDISHGWWFNYPKATGQSSAWTEVMAFIEYWTPMDFGLGVGKSEALGTITYDMSELQPGDVIAYRDDSTGQWDHLALVISVDEGQIVVASNGDGLDGAAYTATYDQIFYEVDDDGDGKADRRVYYDDFMGILLPYSDRNR